MMLVSLVAIMCAHALQSGTWGGTRLSEDRKKKGKDGHACSPELCAVDLK